MAVELSELLNVMVSVDTAPAGKVDGWKDLPSVTEEDVDTVRVATAGAALLPLSVFNAPAASELI